MADGDHAEQHFGVLQHMRALVGAEPTKGVEQSRFVIGMSRVELDRALELALAGGQPAWVAIQRIGNREELGRFRNGRTGPVAREALRLDFRFPT